jgi:two-component system chemotaxis sensor kinase CheA
MDVVKQTIECLRGGLDIHSEPGRGTTFVFRLPLTLAMIEGMVVRVGAEQYIVPTHALVRSLLPRPGMIVTLPDGRGHVVKLTHEMLPLVDLGRLLHTSTNGRDANNNQIILVVEEANRRFALLVNELLNKQQLVIKSLGPVMSHVQGLAGGAVLPDGRVGLILDVATLADQAARVR